MKWAKFLHRFHLVFFFFPNMILIKTEFVLLVLFRLDIEFNRYKLLKKLCILGDHHEIAYNKDKI